MFNTGMDLKKWRKENHLTQEELASMINFSKDRIAHIESQDAKISTRLNNALSMLDKKLNPPPPYLISAWKNVEIFNSERNHFYDPKLKLLEKQLSDILNRIPNRNPEKVDSYLEFLKSCFSYINEIENSPEPSKKLIHESTNKLYRTALRLKISSKTK